MIIYTIVKGARLFGWDIILIALLIAAAVAYGVWEHVLPIVHIDQKIVDHVG